MHKNKKTLILRTCKIGFEKLASQKLTYKYREVKDYWKSRLIDRKWIPKIFDEIHIKNWYKTDSPLIIFEFWGIEWISKYEWKECFKIKLGKLIRIKNYTPEN